MPGKVTAAVIHAIRSMTALAQIYVRMASACLARVDRGVEGFDGEVRFDIYSFGMQRPFSCFSLVSCVLWGLADHSAFNVQ